MYIVCAYNDTDKSICSFSVAFFELIDRGMGIVSLHSKQYPGYRLRMNNFVLEGKVSGHWSQVIYNLGNL